MRKLIDRILGRRNLAPPLLARRSYAGAEMSRLTSSFAPASTSADHELGASLAALRARSRALIRDAPYGARAVSITIDNVVGSGIGLQAQLRTIDGELDQAANDAIETAWADWSEAGNCHVAAHMSFPDFERAIMGEVFAAGEAFVRKRLVAVGASRVPLALELIEGERVPVEFNRAPGPGRLEIRMGVEIDAFGRPLAYFVRRDDCRLGTFANLAESLLERVPAAEMLHLFLPQRSPQTRGQPWLHAALRRMGDLEGYTEAEITAARAAACYMAFITNDGDSPAIPTAVGAVSGSASEGYFSDFQPGMIQRLDPGEDVKLTTPGRPNPAMSEFTKAIVREIAAALGISYETLSRDFAGTNYSSARVSLIEDRDRWRTLQAWLIRSFRLPLHREWLRLAVYAGAIDGVDVGRYLAGGVDKVTFKPRGWSWVDPLREVEAAALAVRSGFTTVSDVIAQNGGGADIEDVLAARRRELDMAGQLGVALDVPPVRTPRPDQATGS